MPTAQEIGHLRCTVCHMLLNPDGTCAHCAGSQRQYFPWWEALGLAKEAVTTNLAFHL